jgi:hypothetical protein
VKAFLASSNEVFERVPLRRLDVGETSFADAEALVASGALAHLEALGVEDNADFIDLVGRSSQASHIEDFTYEGAQHNRVARSLARSHNWQSCRGVDLDGDFLSATAAEKLFQGAHLRGLSRLRLWGSRWPAQTIRVFAESGFTALRELELFNCRLDDEAAEILANAQALRGLRRLALPGSRITGRGASALLVSETLQNLTVLDLFANSVNHLDPKSLARARLSSLRFLDLRAGRKSTADVTAVVGSPVLRGLLGLNLASSNLVDRAIQAFTRASGFTRLAVLDFADNKFGNEGARALAGWRGMAELRSLHLDGNDIRSEGAKALAESPHLSNIRHLSVTRKHVGPTGMKALCKRFGEAVKGF